MLNQRHPAFFWFVLLACVLYAGFIAFATYTTVRYHGQTKNRGWHSTHTIGPNYVIAVEEQGAAAGLRPGDRIVAINGDEHRAFVGLTYWGDIDGGQSYRVDFERAGVRHSVEVAMTLTQGPQLWPICLLAGFPVLVYENVCLVLAGATESVSIAGTALGTICYMAPEALNGGLVDERTDLFAVGVMVVETVTGSRPFTGQTPEQVLTALLRSEYRLPGTSPEIRALDAIVQRCLARDPRDRCGSAAELARDLVPALARCERESAPQDSPVQIQGNGPSSITRA
jgi:serine/threonine protein kinase